MLRPRKTNGDSRSWSSAAASSAACNLQQYREPDISHLLDAGRRLGHSFTVPECPWHHRRVVPSGLSERTTRALLGPSRADGIHVYSARFGTDAELLEMTRAVITMLTRVKQSIYNNRHQAEGAIVPGDWTIAGDVAVRTKMLAVAQRVARHAGDGPRGQVNGVRWMRLGEFERACSNG